ncbi:21421_t:CDS:1, partial [Cetraspora pellucida]
TMRPLFELRTENHSVMDQSWSLRRPIHHYKKYFKTYEYVIRAIEDRRSQ